MRKIEIENKEKYIKEILKKSDRATVFTRLGFGGEKEFCAKVTEEKVLLYRRKFGIFTLFSLTLYGVFSRENGKDYLSVRFSRSRPLSVLWFLWCLLLIVAGFSILLSDTLFALEFLIPGVVLLLPLFIHSKKETFFLLEKKEGKENF